jgi:hypothetical protein
MAKLLSGRQRILNVGVSSYTEDSRVLTATGYAFISGDLRVVGVTTLSGLTYPTSDGTSLQVISTNGEGVLSFQSISSLSGFGWGDDADFGLISDPVLVSTDNGLISNSVGASYDLGFLVISGLIYPDNFVLPSFTVSTLPSAIPAGQMLFVTDETGGSIPAFSDGTNWRRITDAQIIT